MGLEGKRAGAETKDGLERRLTTWHQAMIAIGSTVGVGLFLGSGATIGLAGPAVAVTYLVAALVPLALGLVLAEMATVHPVSGAFGVYADYYIGKWAGFMARLTYWLAQTLAMGAQVTAVAVYFSFWFPDTPRLAFMIGAAAMAIGANALRVGRFGSLEAALSIVKVLAILVFIVLGLALLFGEGGVGLANLVAHGGFFSNGVAGVWLALTLVVTTFFGVEAVAITAGEARDPERTVPRALLALVVALIALYVSSILVVVAVSPWREVAETSGVLTRSPFVKVFAEMGVPYAAGLMNLVVISASLTAATGLLYLGTRMLFSLARAGFVSESIGAVDARGVPLPALGVSSLGVLVAVLLAVSGRRVFLPMYGTGIVALLSTWLLIFVCHLRFRRDLTPAQRARLRLRVPGHPVPSVAAIVVILAAMAATPWVSGLEWTVPNFLLWLGFTGALYRLRRRRRLSSPVVSA